MAAADRNGLSSAAMLRTALLLSALAGCAAAPTAEPLLATVPLGSAQVLVVRASGGVPFVAILTAYERAGAAWARVGSAMPATLGRTGIIPGEQKREGDGHTPAGLHGIGLAFGYEKSLATGLAYRQATDDDYWVDEPSAPSYNRWVKGKPSVSAERMRRDDGAYEVGAVLEWNTELPVPGRGSAIFLHVWGGRDEPTAGCVAMSEADVRRVLAWLDRRRQPVILIAKG